MAASSAEEEGGGGVAVAVSVSLSVKQFFRQRGSVSVSAPRVRYEGLSKQSHRYTRNGLQVWKERYLIY